MIALNEEQEKGEGKNVKLHKKRTYIYRDSDSHAIMALELLRIGDIFLAFIVSCNKTQPL